MMQCASEETLETIVLKLPWKMRWTTKVGQCRVREGVIGLVGIVVDCGSSFEDTELRIAALFLAMMQCASEETLETVVLTMENEMDHQGRAV